MMFPPTPKRKKWFWVLAFGVKKIKWAKVDKMDFDT
jgi:hypothetical protein